MWLGLYLWWPLLQVPVNPKLRWLLLMVVSGSCFQSPWRLLGIRGVCLVLTKVILPSWKLFRFMEVAFSWACFWGGHSLGPAPTEVAIMGLVPWMLLTQAYSSSGSLLVLAPTEVAGLSLLLQSLITCTCSCRQYWLRPALAEVSTLERSTKDTYFSVGKVGVSGMQWKEEHDQNVLNENNFIFNKNIIK